MRGALICFGTEGKGAFSVGLRAEEGLDWEVGGLWDFNGLPCDGGPSGGGKRWLASRGGVEC